MPPKQADIKTYKNCGKERRQIIIIVYLFIFFFMEMSNEGRTRTPEQRVDTETIRTAPLGAIIVYLLL